MLETLGHYKILDRIGRGGMGEVYRARDMKLGRTVAIKVLPDALAAEVERRERLMREARAAAALSHPNIAALYEVGEDQGHVFLVFEFVPGDTLKTTIAGRPLNPRRAVDLGVEIADALADAHAAGIVHRDIKPENIIETPRGHAKVLDFGLATWTSGGAERDAAATMLATGSGTVFGTVAYMSPEQVLGEPLDHRTDIFSFGSVLYEMLTGRQPFTGATPAALAMQIVQTPAAAPSSIDKAVPPELDTIVAKMLAKKVDDRYEAAATLAAELRSIGAILDVREGTEPPSVAAGTRPPGRRRRRGIGRSSVLALLAVAVVAGGAAWPAARHAAATAWRRAFAPSPAPVIAVIPLETDAGQQIFADGLTDDLITRLAQTPGLKVIGRSATRSYRGRPPRDVASELGAGVVLTGSVRPSADVVRVSLELIDPRDGTDLWTGQYTREVRDIFAVQSQVADDVAQALKVKLQATPRSTRAAMRRVDPRAYDLYVHGRQAMADRHVPQAIDLYQQAAAADPGLVEALAGLAEALHFEGVYAGEPDNPDRVERIRAAATRAYEQDPDLPQTNLAMGFAAGSLTQALGYMRHAIDVDPSYAEGYHGIGDQLQDVDPELALKFYRKSLELDRRLDVNLADIAIELLLLDRPAEAEKALAAAGATLRAPFLATLDLDARRYDKAVADLAGVPGFRDAPPAWLLYVLAIRSAGRTDEAFQEATALTSRHPDFCDGRAVLAGLTEERSGASHARQLAVPILAAAHADGARASVVGCGATAAAATGNVREAAAIFDRIASNETLLRGWAVAVFGHCGRLELHGRVYPWSRIIDAPAVASARARIEQAYARLRADAEGALNGLP